MRIIETFICKIPVTNVFVKVHRGRDRFSADMYFIELPDGKLEEIGRLYFEEIKSFE